MQSNPANIQHMILAQAQLDAVPASYVKWFFVILFVLICMAGVIVGIIKALQQPEKQTLNDDPPIEVRKAAKRFNHDLFVSQHAEVTHRLNEHDKEFDKVWDTLRKEDADIRRQMEESFFSIQRALGRIEGKLEQRD
jgi:hypothetical protein